MGLPIACVVSAVGVGLLAGVGSGLLVLAAGALIGAVGLFWASVRTLSGDAPLAADFEELAVDGGEVGALVEEKRRLLRALKDLESEHAIGKLDDADYAAIVAKYRADAKGVMRKMEVEVAPFREQAERMARDYLKSQGIGAKAPESEAGVREAERLPCTGCGTSNEVDAAFCKKCGASIAKERPSASA